MKRETNLNKRFFKKNKMLAYVWPNFLTRCISPYKERISFNNNKAHNNVYL